ncbi:MAG: Plasmid stabilization system protein [Chthoniobacter sp.]|jgi:toxin ParE1/3/4|nr:Plasmid stabilization system protein [Chthoniobacter sp.]
MGLPVIFTPQAQADLKQIVRFNRRDSPDRARAFGLALVDEALSLTSFPERARVVPEFNEPTVREIVHGSYRIIHEVLREPAGVYVLRFCHAARGEPEIEG